MSSPQELGYISFPAADVNEARPRVHRSKSDGSLIAVMDFGGATLHVHGSGEARNIADAFNRLADMIEADAAQDEALS